MKTNIMRRLRRPWGRCPQTPGFKAPTGEHRGKRPVTLREVPR